MLTRVDGPECPRCGCTDSEIVRWQRGWSGRRQARRRCRHCGAVFSGESEQDDDEEDAVGEPAARQPVRYVTTRCPSCGSADVKVTSTRRPIRHHKCQACGETFKSYEE